jgi:hypothetical protein
MNALFVFKKSKRVCFIMLRPPLSLRYCGARRWGSKSSLFRFSTNIAPHRILRGTPLGLEFHTPQLALVYN